ncbi:uncharacterized protein LOC131053078 [Cryptomeria japonica]|uniref:uncharacterized protein LOC131053078 n=1 Tax=Cryptomeria japonica TaxID=3369 RepID=UPI0027DA2858|nr:uncharacterized protein LOC131053078 [Cryptomeria japonica]
MTRGKGNKGRGSTKQGRQAPTKVNGSDDRGDEVKNLKSLNQSLLVTITNERKQIDELKYTLQMNKSQWDSCEKAMKNTIEELKNELTQTRALSENHEKSCTQFVRENFELESNLKECYDKIKELQSLKNELDQTRILSESNEKLCTQLAQERDELENKVKECKDEIQELQSVKNELNQTRMLFESRENLCSQLGQEKIKLENKVKECNDMINELQGKMNEDRCLWDASKADTQTEIAKLQTVLDSVVNEKNLLNQTHEELCAKHRNDKNELIKCNEGAKKLEAKMVEYQKLWDFRRVNLEGKITEQQIEIDEVRKLSKKREELCTELMQEKIKMGKDLEKIKDGSKKLNAKMTQDKKLWDSCKTKLEGRVAGLQNELNEKKILSQGHEELCTKLRQEKNDLENKLEEFNDRVAELQNELNETRNLCQKNENLSTELRQENIELGKKLKESNDESKELKAKLTEDGCLWNLCKAELEGAIVELEGTIAGLQNELNETKESINETKKLKEKMTEDGCLWEICKGQFEDKVAKLENEVKEARQEKNEFENKVKQCNDMIEELKGKMNQDRSLWDAYKADMQVEIAKLQDTLDSAVNERKVLKQRHEELCAKNRNDKNELRKCNEGSKKLKAKMVEDQRLWDSSRVNLEGKIAELQNEIDGTNKLNAKMTQDKQLWDSCKTTLEDMVLGLQNELNATRVLSQGYEELCIKLGQEKKDLENKVKEFNGINKKLQNKIIEDGVLFDACKVELKGRVAELQDELDKTRNLWRKHENLSTELRQENIELANKLKHSYDETEELKEKLTEDCCLWNLSKTELEGTVAELQNELNETRLKHEEFCIQLTDEKKHLEEKLKEFDNETKELKGKMTQDRGLWDSSKAEWEHTVAGLQNELNATRLKLKEFYIDKKHLEEKLKAFDCNNKELQKELDKTNFLCQNHEKKCTALKEQKSGLRKKLKECDDRIGELNAKLNLLDTCNENLEGKVAGLLYEKRITSQEHDELCNHLTDEKYMLEHKLNECNDRNNKLHAKMKEDLCLWETCTADFSSTVAGLQNELDLKTNKGRILSQKYVELYSECAFLKAQLRDYDETLSSVENERLGLTSLSESNAKKAECLQTKVQLICNEKKELSQKLEELITENGFMKQKVENYDKKHDSVERENSSLKQEMHELQNKLAMWADEGKRKVFSYDDTLDSTEEKRQLLRTPAGSIGELVEDVVTETRSVKQEALRLNQQNQVLQNEILDHKSLLQTQAGIVAEMNAENSKLKIELEELRRSLQETEESNARVIQKRRALWEDQVKFKEIVKQREDARRDSFGSHKAFPANLMSHILLDSRSRESKCLSADTKHIILPPNALFSGCPYGWCGGIV